MPSYISEFFIVPGNRFQDYYPVTESCDITQISYKISHNTFFYLVRFFWNQDKKYIFETEIKELFIQI